MTTVLSSCESQQGAANGQDSRSVFRDAQGLRLLDAGSRTSFLGFAWILELQFSFFLHDVWP